jgi:hypothetical protein
MKDPKLYEGRLGETRTWLRLDSTIVRIQTSLGQDRYQFNFMANWN